MEDRIESGAGLVSRGRSSEGSREENAETQGRNDFGQQDLLIG